MFKRRSLSRKILITTIALIIIKTLSFIPIFRINPYILSDLADKNNLFSLMNVFSGNGIKRFSVASLGIGPYITASIIIQLSATIFNHIDRLANNGEYGKRKLDKYIFIMFVFLAAFNSWGIIKYLVSARLIANTNVNMVIAVLSLTLGSIIIVLLSKLIDKYGFGDGVSVILFLNAITTILTAFVDLGLESWSNKFNIKYIIIIVALVLLLVYSFYIDKKKHMIPITSSRIIANFDDSYIPVKFNINGVMPIIISTTMMSLPGSIAMILGKEENMVLKTLNANNWFDLKNPIFSLGYLVFVVLMLVFSIYYAKISYDPVEVALNMKESGISVEGLNTTKKTIDYLSELVARIAYKSCFAMIGISTIPMILNRLVEADIALSGTSFVIVSTVFYNLIQEWKFWRIAL